MYKPPFFLKAHQPHDMVIRNPKGKKAICGISPYMMIPRHGHKA